MALFGTVTAPHEGPVIEGRGLTLRMAQLSDYAEWAQLRAESQDFLVPWEPSWAHDELSRNAFRRRLRHYHKDLRDESAYALFLFRHGDQRLLGGITISNVRRGVTQTGTLGYWIGERYAGYGHMTEAVHVVVRFMFGTLGLHRAEAACLPRNVASIRVLDKVGFQREGLARRYLKINGVWQDHLLFGLLADDPVFATGDRLQR